MEGKLLTQIIDKPTRVPLNETANILDLIITNNSEVIREVSILPTKLSDHEIVSVILSDQFKCQTPDMRPKRNNNNNQLSFNSLNFTKADFSEISEELKEIDWDTMKQQCTSETFPETFYKEILSICAKHTPQKQFSYKKKSSKYQKLCYSINRKRRKIKSRIKVIQKSKADSDRLPYYFQKLLTLEKEAQEKITRVLKAEEEQAINALKDNPKFFYSFAKKKGNTKTRIGPLRITENGREIYLDDPQDIADTLQNQFTSVFSNPANITVDPLDERRNQNESYLEDISFDLEDVIKAINEIISHSSPGDDGFPASLLKECKEDLAYPILLLWKESLSDSYIHPMFLHQLITPIYKGK